MFKEVGMGSGQGTGEAVSALGSVTGGWEGGAVVQGFLGFCLQRQ